MSLPAIRQSGQAGQGEVVECIQRVQSCMAVCGIIFRNFIVGTGLAISLLCMNGLRKSPPYLDLTEKLFLSVDEWFLAKSGVL